MACLLLLLTGLCQQVDESRYVTQPVRGIVTLENGRPASNFRVYTAGSTGKQKPPEVRTSKRGTFTLRVAPGPFRPNIFASSDDGKLLGHFDAYKRSRLLRIKVRPKHTVTCVVLDKQGRPLAGADVGLLSTGFAIMTASTDKSGKCAFDIPVDMSVATIYAKKDDHGFDYYEHYTMWPGGTKEPPPDSVELKLEGATTCRVRLIDRAGNPVAGIPLVPWTIQRPGKLADANLSGSPEMTTKTDSEGVATFRWLPVDCERSVSFLVRDRLRYIDQRPQATRLNDEIQTTVYKCVRVSGVVRHADGSPAAGVRLQGESSGAGNYFRGYTKTNSKGEYHFDIYPNQQTSIEVTDERWSAEAQAVSLEPNESKKNLDFTLLEGAILRGTIKSPDGSEVSPDVHVTVVSNGRVVRWQYVNADGDYSVRLGPGTYSVTLPGADTNKSITVMNGQEIVLDGPLPQARQEGVFTGVVVDTEGRPVADAAIYGAGTNQRRTSYRGRTNAKGEFRLQRQGPTVFMCVHHSKPMAVMATVPFKTNHRTFKLARTPSASGRLLSEDGDEPLVNSKLQWQIQRPGFEPFKVTSYTDSEGRFRLTAPSGNGGLLHVVYQKVGDGPKEATLRKVLEIKDIVIDAQKDRELGEIKVADAKDNRPGK